LQLRRSSDAADLGPNLKGLGLGGSILDGWNLVAAEKEEVADRVVGRRETLCLAWRLEPLHLPLSPSRRLVRVLRPVVQPLVLSVLDRGHHLALGRSAARQLVGHHDTRCPKMADFEPRRKLCHRTDKGAAQDRPFVSACQKLSCVRLRGRAAVCRPARSPPRPGARCRGRSRRARSVRSG